MFPEPYRKEDGSSPAAAYSSNNTSSSIGDVEEGGGGNTRGRASITATRNRRGSLSINVHDLVDESEEPQRVLESYFVEVVLPLAGIATSSTGHTTNANTIIGDQHGSGGGSLKRERERGHSRDAPSTPISAAAAAASTAGGAVAACSGDDSSTKRLGSSSSSNGSTIHHDEGEASGGAKKAIEGLFDEPDIEL